MIFSEMYTMGSWHFAFLWMTLSSLSKFSEADIYLHNPRGSNNRLDENTANRQTNNRIFDSQNNNRGGYNVGDAGSTPANGNENLQYQMKYFQSSASSVSQLEIEWTMQHGCDAYKNGQTTNKEIDCNVIIQYMCQDPTHLKYPEDRLRDGTTRNTQDFTAKGPNHKYTSKEINALRKSNAKLNRGLHEPWFHYTKCHQRERNKGLYTADVKLGNNGKYSSAINTRQNPNGNRNGYECPEERDYYPYWHTSPWKDIAILTTNTSRCRHYKFNSFNVRPYHECVEFDNIGHRIPSRWNNQNECKSNGGRWILFYNYLEKAPQYRSQGSCEDQSEKGEFDYETFNRHKRIWAVPYDSDSLIPECLVALDAPECSKAKLSRSNHLGNTQGGYTPYYTWNLPFFPSYKKQSCVFRIRYNISSYDYNINDIDYRSNIAPPVKNNPTVTIEGSASLQLAINTQQLGRTFQDRSHMFWLMPRPPKLEYGRLHNLNVRGKRGNIVQVYPAVEYDFVPTSTRMTHDSLLHIQWTGSNTHNNNNQGNDGNGNAGTDRNNIIQVEDLGQNLPLPFQRSSFFHNAKIRWIYFEKENISPMALALNLGSSGFYRCLNQTECPENDHKNFVYSLNKNKLNNQLNNAPASYPGVVISLKSGEYYFMCTRNNNFSNRSQKGFILVK